jgi:hypothetical protein
MPLIVWAGWPLVRFRFGAAHVVGMSIITDRHGNAHRSAGVPGAGEFTSRRNPPAPAGLVDEEYFDEAEWRARQEEIIDEGERDGHPSDEPPIELLDDATWGGTPF